MNSILSRSILLSLIFGAPSGLADELIIRLENPQNFTALKTHSLQIKEVLIPDMGLILVEHPSVGILDYEQMSEVDGIRYAQPNDQVELRALPNDPEFGKLWSFKNTRTGADISAEKAWDITTGGVTANGDRIVAAVIDSGIEREHPELKENIWVNEAEVAGNGIDDDGNGYIDDVSSWNAFNNSADTSPGTHGTHVAGIIGAHGNNAMGLTGVNWNVGIMDIEGASGTTSIVLKALGFARDHKKKWLDSQGKYGANVVAVNMSFGIDRGDCASSRYKAWNDMFEEIGKYGILAVGATANNRDDIDRVGDVPTGCASDYVVAVTNTTSSDQLYSSAGYGKKSIDLGAPGTQIYSTVLQGKAGNATGTSMAAPHVTGSIALMHAAASKDFADYYLRSPGPASKVLKKILMDSVDELRDLKEVTVSGGRLNIEKSLMTISRWKL